MNVYTLFKMFVLCHFCNIDMYIFDKINVLYFYSPGLQFEHAYCATPQNASSQETDGIDSDSKFLF